MKLYSVERLFHRTLCHERLKGPLLVTGPSLLTYWYFHLPNFILAALMYTLLGRALLGLIVGPDSSNYIWRFFCRFTDPVVAAVAVVTPKAAAPVLSGCLAWSGCSGCGSVCCFCSRRSAPRPR